LLIFFLTLVLFGGKWSDSHTSNLPWRWSPIYSLNMKLCHPDCPAVAYSLYRLC